MLSGINKLMLLLAGSSALQDNDICSVLCVIFLFSFLVQLLIPVSAQVSREFCKPLGCGYNLHLCIF